MAACSSKAGDASAATSTATAGSEDQAGRGAQPPPQGNPNRDGHRRESDRRWERSAGHSAANGPPAGIVSPWRGCVRSEPGPVLAVVGRYVLAVRIVPPDDEGPALSKPGALSRDQLVALVRQILAAIETGTEAEQDRLVQTFQQSVAHPAALDLIFSPKRLPDGSWPDPSPEEIVDEALAYRPIELGP